MYIAGYDIKKFYNKLRAPDFLIPLLGLPKIEAQKMGRGTG